MAGDASAPLDLAEGGDEDEYDLGEEEDDYDIADEDDVGLEGGEGYGDYDMLEAAEVDADEDKAEEERANLAELFKQAQEEKVAYLELVSAPRSSNAVARRCRSLDAGAARLPCLSTSPRSSSPPSLCCAEPNAAAQAGRVPALREEVR